MEYKLGDKVRLINCGRCYPNVRFAEVLTYIHRYKPINVKLTKNRFGGEFVDIYEGYDTPKCLDLRTDLQWKIRYIAESKRKFPSQDFFFLSSNENHFLVVGEGGFEKI